MEPKWSDLLRQINAFLTPAKEVVVVVRPNPNLDTVAGALALAQALRKIGRRASVICPTKLTGLKELKGVEEILTDLPQKQLTITVNYQQGSFEKVDPQKADKSLQLNVLPKAGQQPIEPINIDAKEYESKPNVAILIEIENLAHLQDFYTKNRTFFDQTPSINIDYHPNNAKYGKVNLIDPKASSVSEMITLMLYDLRVAMDGQIADNLYQGLADKTQNFAKDFHSANLLEAASICMRYKRAAEQPMVGVQPRTQAQAGGQMGAQPGTQPAPQAGTQPMASTPPATQPNPSPPTTPTTQSPSWPQTTSGWK